MPRITHNMSGTPEYITWRNMQRRCNVPTDVSYPSYGGRGISVCDKWRDPRKFLKDMGSRPLGAQLDRSDPNGNDTPENCRWASAKTQANNRRNTVSVEVDGVMLPVSAAAEMFNLKPATLWARVVRQKIPAPRALTPHTLRKPRRHGTRHGYEAGCRCKSCRAAHAAHHRAMRARRKAMAASSQLLLHEVTR